MNAHAFANIKHRHMLSTVNCSDEALLERRQYVQYGPLRKEIFRCSLESSHINRGGIASWLASRGATLNASKRTTDSFVCFLSTDECRWMPIHSPKSVIWRRVPENRRQTKRPTSTE